jgi:hypothetical protein
VRHDWALAGRAIREEASKQFFFEKKHQKTFVCCPQPTRYGMRPILPETSKSFLVLFFKKERLPSLPYKCWIF